MGIHVVFIVMDFAVIGDVHGRDLTGFEEYLEEENPDRVYCTADFDLVDSYRQFTDMTEDFDTSIVPANHEHAIREGLAIMSRSMDEIGVDIFDLMDQWEESDEYSFIEKVDDQDSYTAEFSLEDRDAVLIHGALEGDASSYGDCPENRRQLWNRLSNSRDHVANFYEMEIQDIEIMFRSHDHIPEITYIDSDRGVVSLNPKRDGDRFGLRDDKMYTVTTGAWYDGWFLSGDTDPEDRDYPVIQYHKDSF